MNCNRSCKTAPRLAPKRPTITCRQNFKSACPTPTSTGTPRKVPPRPFACGNEPVTAACATVVGSKSYEEEYAKHLEKQIHYLKLENELRRNSQNTACGSSSYRTPEEQLDERLREANKTILDLKEQLSEKQHGLKVVAAHRDELQQKLATINETFLGQKAELMENMLQVRRDVERLKLERKKLDFESELKSKDMMRLKDDIQQARVKTENMEEETIALKEKYAQLNYYAEEKENEVVAARKELFAVRESYEKSDLCLANQTNEEMNRLLTDALADAEAMKVRIEQEEATKATLTEQLETVLTETAGFVAQTTRLEAQVQQIQDRRANLDQINSDMVDQLSRLQISEKEAILRLESEEKLLIEKEVALTKLQTDLDVMELRTREMENTLNAHEEENRNVVEFTRLLEAELQELERQKVTVEAELDLTKRKVREKDDLIAQLRSYTVELERKLEELEAEKWRYKREQVAKWNQMMKLTDQIQHVSKDVVDDIRECKKGPTSDISRRQMKTSISELSTDYC